MDQNGEEEGLLEKKRWTLLVSAQWGGELCGPLGRFREIDLKWRVVHIQSICKLPAGRKKISQRKGAGDPPAPVGFNPCWVA